MYVDSAEQPLPLDAASGRAAGAPVATGADSAARPAGAAPGRRAGLYELALRSGRSPDRGAAGRSARRARSAAILVVLPALTWQGLNPVDDDGDGIPTTLLPAARSSSTVRWPTACRRFADEAALLLPRQVRTGSTT